MSAGPVYELHVPGEATRRAYAVYLLVAQQRDTGRVTGVYIGKTGDNREGGNPIISRVGNHMSYNTLHSQARNRFRTTEDLDFRFFYSLFGSYTDPKISRDGIDVINEMERQLNRRTQDAFGELVVNAYKGSGRVPRTEREKRVAMCSVERMERLDALIVAAKQFIDAAGSNSGSASGAFCTDSVRTGPVANERQ
jgi:hypothetical protein